MTSAAMRLKPIHIEVMQFTVQGLSPLISHAWSEKALRMIRDKKAGRKTKERSVCDPDQEFKDAAYYTENGGYGIPIMALKSAIISASHKDIGIEKTLVRKALFFRCVDAGGIVPIRCSEPVMREDCVRVGMGSTDIRYRPEFRDWEMDVVCEVDTEMLRVEDLMNLVDRAGFGVGIGEWRPEKGGEFGRFRVKRG
jgi:hypothetical protein